MSSYNSESGFSIQGGEIPTESVHFVFKYKWIVSIPNSSTSLNICYTKLTLWQRMWMRFIGWGVKPYGEFKKENK